MTVFYTTLTQTLLIISATLKRNKGGKDEKKQTINMDSENAAARANNGKYKISAMVIFDPVSVDNTYTDIVLLKYLLLFRAYNKET